MIEKKQYIFYLPTAQREWLEKMSKETTLSISEVVQFIIRKAMLDEEKVKNEILYTFFGIEEKKGA